MADSYLDGLRRLFTGSSTPLRQRQLDQQEQQIVNPQLRGAEVMPATGPGQPAAPMTFDQQMQADELERQERQKRLQIELERIRNGG